MKIMVHENQEQLNEGIDLIGKKVAYNPKHSRFVDTREETMLPIVRQIKFRVLNTDRVSTYPVLSLFGRNSNDNGTWSDGNPLVYALKGERGWAFRSENDRKQILAQATRIAKNLFAGHPIDTVVFTPSTNKLNQMISDIVKEACPDAAMLPNSAIRKKRTQDVFNWLDYDWIRYVLGHYDPETRGYRRDDPRWKDYVKAQEERLKELRADMGDTFTYHNLPMQYRKAIPQSAEIGDECGDDVLLNDKDIAIIDDTLTTGKTLSDISELILDTYVPKSITFITMFSSKDSVDLSTVVPTAKWKDNLRKGR